MSKKFDDLIEGRNDTAVVLLQNALGPLCQFLACQDMRDALVGLDEALPVAQRRDLGPLWVLRRFPIPSACIKDDEVVEVPTEVDVAPKAPTSLTEKPCEAAIRSCNSINSVSSAVAAGLGVQRPDPLHQDGTYMPAAKVRKFPRRG